MRTSRTVLAPTLVIFFLATRVVASETANPAAGHWEGAIELPGTTLEVRIDLNSPAGGEAWTGTIDIPVQTIRGFALADVAVDATRVGFRMPDIPGDPTFAGTLAADAQSISGTFSQGGQSFPFRVERRAATPRAGETPAKGIPGEGLVGHWQGSLRVGPAELRLVLHVEDKDGGWHATLDSIDQGAKGIPVSQVTFAEGKVHLELAAIRGTFDGTVSEDGSELKGTWKQGPLDAPLVFRRLAAEPEFARLQEPKKPYPYDEHEVEFAGGAPDVTLAGTITLPRGEGPFPGVVLLSGSGPQDRNETVMGHRPFLVLADHLTRQGIAVLRFDDRGFGQSTGRHGTATHTDFAADARAAFAFLRQQPRVDPLRVGLCGHSEGALHAPLVAIEAGDVAFMVMLAGVGVPVEQLLQRQREDILRVLGLPADAVQEQLTLGAELIAILREHGNSNAAKDKLRGRLAASAARYTPAEREAIGFSDSMIDQTVAVMTTPWYVTLLSYDPAPALAQVRCPVLALNGTKDVQVAWEENLEGIRAGLAAGGNNEVTIKTLPGLNHLFQPATTGAVAEYATIAITMSPDVLQLVSDWILQQTT